MPLFQQNFKITIVGSGIIGLSVAEYLSRNCISNTKNQIQIVSNDHPLTGSSTAAANLATKGQLFARDPHFKLKLKAKKIYENWIKSLLVENSSDININSIFKRGLGIDYFLSADDMEKHYTRVKQSDAELLARGLPQDAIVSSANDRVLPWTDLNTIIYKNEMWVDANALLLLLKQTLKKRGVSFVQESFTQQKLNTLKHNDILIFCTGAWTKELLIQLALPLPEKIAKQERLSIGSTFSGKNQIENLMLNTNDQFILHEKLSSSLKNKVTITAGNQKQYISSSTIRIRNISENKTDELESKNNELLSLAGRKNQSEPFLKSQNNLERKDGLRAGYGHSEIVVEKLNVEDKNIFVCAGAHKSGFLFAPVVGELLDNIIKNNN